MGKETYETVVPGLTPPQKEEKEGQETDNASAVEPKKEVVQPTQQIESVQPTATTTPKKTDNTDAKQSSDVTQSKDKVNPYTVVLPPEQPDYDAIEKGVEDKDKEQRKADAKRQRSRAIVSAVGDGLSALSNLYFTTQYAPNMNTGRGELSAKNVERWDKYVKARDAKLAEYKKTAIERADKKYENDYTRWKDEATFAQNKRKQDMEVAKAEFEMALKRAKDERDAERNYWLNRKTQGEIDRIEFDNRIKDAEVKYAEDIKKAEFAYKKSQLALNNEKIKTEKVKQISLRKGSGKNAKTGPTITIRYDSEGNRTVQINGQYATSAEVEKIAKEFDIPVNDIYGDLDGGSTSYNWDDTSYGDNFYVVQKGKKQNEKPY